MKSLIDALITPVVVISRDYTIRFMNAAAAEQAGVQTGQAPHCFELLQWRTAPCDAPDAVCPIREVFLTGRPLKTFYHHRPMKASREVVTEVSASPVLDEQGIVSGVIEFLHSIDQSGIVEDGHEIPAELTLSRWKQGDDAYYNASVRDITERRRSTLELQTSREAILREHEKLTKLFRLVDAGKREWEKTMDCVQDMVVLVNGEAEVRRCNRTFKDFLGLTYDQTLGQNCYDLLTERGLVIPRSFIGEIDVELRSGERWFRVSVYPLREPVEAVAAGFVMTIHDITQIKRVTEKLEFSNREIEKAYAELKQSQLQVLQQEKMASIGQLAAGVAHEINNPVGFISSNLNSLQKYLARILDYIGAANELSQSCPSGAAAKLSEVRAKLKIDFIVDDVQKLITESLDGADRVRTIVQNLKSFARVDQAEARPANINDCIESTLNIAWNEIKYKATVSKEYGDLPQTRCFPQQLNQVFMNLLVNAAHAIETTGTISIRTWAEHGSIFASVSDTGSGITAENLPRIFEPFFTTKEAGKGTGLGLSITYDIVKKHNGEISVQSAAGKGTTFLVKIPVVGENGNA